MDGDTIGGIFVGVVIVILITFCCCAIFTDEYEVVQKKDCIQYSTNTGTCIKNNIYWVCQNDGGGREIVHVCGKDSNECNKVCAEYGKTHP